MSVRMPLLAAASLLAVATASTAFAQAGQPVTNDNSPKTGGQQTDDGSIARPRPGDALQGPTTEAAAGQDIIVTAERRSTSLSKTPISVAVISADTLAKAQVLTTEALREAAPGLSVRPGQNSEQLNFSLRGQSQDPYSNTRPGVLPYFNDVQIGSQGQSGLFYDLSSVQVLKGPQGTLFGRSATGGALLFTTQKPTDKFGGYVDGLYGNYNQGKIEGAVNVPLSGDDLLFRIAGIYFRRDGFQYNIYDGEQVGRQRKFAVRPSLTARFGPSVKNELVVDYYHSNSQPTSGVLSGLMPYTGTGGPPYIPIQYLYAGTSTPTRAVTGACTVQAFVGFGACPPVNPLVSGFYQGYFSNPKHPAGGIDQVLADQQARGPFRIDQDGRLRVTSRSTIVTNTTTFDIAPDTQIKNIFGYNQVHTVNQTDSDGTPYGISQTAGYGVQYHYRGYSNELQLLGKLLDNKFDYVIGGYYSSERAHTNQQVQFFDILFGGQSTVYDYIARNRTLAGYAQGTYHIWQGLSATAGVRYTSERVGNDIQPDDGARKALGNPAPPGFDYSQRRTFDRTSWTAGLQDQVTSQLLLFVKASRAYKSGGFNGVVPARVGGASVGGNGYDAERVTDAEGGAKFNGYLGGMPVRLNADFYYMWIDGGQRAAFAFVGGAPAAVTVNVPTGRTYGVELDGQVSPTRYLTIGGNFNYTNASFRNGSVFVVGSAQLFDQVPDTPRYSAAAFADVSVPLGGGFKGLLHGDAYYQSSTTTSPQSYNSAGTHIDHYVLANFRIGVESDKGWSITGNLKNAFNKTFYAGGLQTGQIYQINTLVPGDPRTYTVDVRFKF